MSERIWVVQRREPGGEWEAWCVMSRHEDEESAQRMVRDMSRYASPEFRAWPYVPAPEGADQ